MADRGEVKIREGNLDTLIKIYEEAYRRIVDEITTASDAGKIRRFAVLARINKHLADLGVDVDKWVNTELPQYYRDGANAAAQDLKDAGYNIAKQQNFAVIDKEAILALTDDVALSFGESFKAMNRSASVLLGTAIRQQLNFIIAEGKLTGEARKTVSDRVVQYLKDKGLGALKDAAGREWSYETYSRMLVRTKAVEARNQGLQNRMLTSGYDLVQVTNHRSSHPACARYESQILTLTGSTKVGTKLPGGFSVFDTYTNAIEQGLFHPNAVLSGSTFGSYGALNQMIGADYEGPAVAIHTSNGHDLTIGPNHPVLTQRGLVKASLLTEQDYLVYDSRVFASKTSGETDLEQMPLVEDAFETLLFSERRISTVAPSRDYFHGDGIFCKGEVKVINPTGSLLGVLDPIFLKKPSDSQFVGTNMEITGLSGFSASDFGLDTIDLSPPGSVSSGLSVYRFVHISSLHNIRFNGKAFDASTQSGLYNSNGFVVSNCQHAINVINPEIAAKTHAYENPYNTLSLAEYIREYPDSPEAARAQKPN